MAEIPFPRPNLDLNVQDVSETRLPGGVSIEQIDVADKDSMGEKSDVGCRLGNYDVNFEVGET